MPIEKKRCITHEFRLSFPALLTPKAYQDQPEKYSCVALFDKKINLSKAPTNKASEALSVSMKEAFHNAMVEKFGPKEKWPKNYKTPFRDGEERSDTPGYENCIFVTMSNKNPPGVVNQQRQPVLNERDIYAGCYCRAEVIAFAYDKAGNRGVSFSLQNIQKVKDGEPFGSRKNAEDVFDSIEDGSDDESNYSDDSSSEDDDY